MANRTGAVAIWAASVNVTAMVTAVGTLAPQRDSSIRSRSIGASITIPDVAATESANPQLTDNEGTTTTRISTAVAKTDGPGRRPPTSSDSTTTAAITPARRTLGSGWTTIT